MRCRIASGCQTDSTCNAKRQIFETFIGATFGQLKSICQPPSAPDAVLAPTLHHRSRLGRLEMLLRHYNRIQLALPHAGNRKVAQRSFVVGKHVQEGW